jgi:hypothetical protein
MHRTFCHLSLLLIDSLVPAASGILWMEVTMSRYTSLFYTQPTFLEGVGRLLDVGGFFDDHDVALSETEIDRVALASDWYAVGEDLRRAISLYAKQRGMEIRHGGTATPAGAP